MKLKGTKLLRKFINTFCILLVCILLLSACKKTDGTSQSEESKEILTEDTSETTYTTEIEDTAEPAENNAEESSLMNQEDKQKEAQQENLNVTEESKIKDDSNSDSQELVQDTIAEAIMTTTGVKDTDNFYGIEFTEDSDIFARIKGKSYKDDCTVPLSDLRYLHVCHIGFDGQTHEGEIVCNKSIAEDLLEIFEALYEAKYPIEKIRLVDEYNAEDEASMADNNSSCFNFRFISHTTKVSNHGYGKAIDINPLYNPYVKTVDGKLSVEPANGVDYVDRTKDFAYKIDENDLAYQLFTAHGFTWGGAWNSSKDYQHFEKK